MRLTRSQICSTLASTALLGVLAACSSNDQEVTAPPPPTTATASPSTNLVAEEFVQGEATIESIDRTKRTVTLRNAEGRLSTVKVPADVDLDRLKAGDDVAIGLYQSLSARVLPPGSAALGSTFAAGSTPPGEPGGRAWGRQLTIVAAVTAVDLVNNTVTVRGGEGKSRTIAVKDPRMQQRLRNLNVGDLVELTYAEGVAASVTPKS
jgi:hypothetical protein